MAPSDTRVAPGAGRDESSPGSPEGAARRERRPSPGRRRRAYSGDPAPGVPGSPRPAPDAPGRRRRGGAGRARAASGTNRDGHNAGTAPPRARCLAGPARARGSLIPMLSIARPSAARPPGRGELPRAAASQRPRTGVERRARSRPHPAARRGRTPEAPLRPPGPRPPDRHLEGRAMPAPAVTPAARPATPAPSAWAPRHGPEGRRREGRPRPPRPHAATSPTPPPAAGSRSDTPPAGPPVFLRADITGAAPGGPGMGWRVQGAT